MHKLIFVFLAVGILFFMQGIQIVNAEEDCYIQLQISENIGDDGVGFSLYGASKVFGDYGDLTNSYEAEKDGLYSVNVYGGSGLVIGKYSADSSAVTWVEKAIMDEDGNIRYFGDVIIDDSGIIESFIPCDSDISRVTVGYDGKETDLGFDLNDLGDEEEILVNEPVASLEVIGYTLSGAGESAMNGKYLDKGIVVNGKKVFVNSMNSAKQISFDGSKWVAMDTVQPIPFFMVRYSAQNNGGDTPSESGWTVERGIAPAPVGKYIYSEVSLSPIEKNKGLIIAVIIVLGLLIGWMVLKRRGKND